MKLCMIICSDYDRTFKVNQQISKRNLQAVKDLRKKGHLFVVNTGRTFQSFREESNLHTLEFDYAICGSGSQIINHSFKLIHQTTFNKEIIKTFINELPESSAILIQYSNQHQWQILRTNQENGWDTTVYQQIPQQLNTMSCRFGTIEEAKRFHDNFPFNLNAFLNYYSIDMVASKMDKANGLHQLVKLLAVNPSEVFVVGDGLNDLPMLTEFNGAVVEHGQDAVKKLVKKVVIDVASFIYETIDLDELKPVA